MKRNHYTLSLYPLFSSSGYITFSWPWWKEYLNPNNYWRTVKYFCQRGYRGYADCDSWDANSYSEAVLLGLITRLKEHSHGYPTACNNLNEWKEILQQIIDGFEAAIELREEKTLPDGIYSKEPLEWKKTEDGFFELINTSPIPLFREDLYKLWEDPLKEKQRIGMELLIQWWPCLWD